MRLEVYYPQDVRNALLAAEQASVRALHAAGGEDNEFARGYREGYQSALMTIALAFGLVELYSRTERHALKETFLSATTAGASPSIKACPSEFSKGLNPDGTLP